jgi:spheroidene monooxygenase
MQAVTISFFRFEGVANRLWAFSRMGFARRPLRRIPGIGFHKLFGTGTGEGFTPRPNLGVYAILATWPDLQTARRAVSESGVFESYRRHAAESATIYLSAIASRGAWDGGAPFALDGARPTGLMAVLTRATIRKRHVLRFWREQPDISGTVRGEAHMAFKIGMGEVPFLQQVTFSVWDDAEAMKAFAYRSATHGEAVRRVRQGGWFREELYARFAVLLTEGRWNGRPFAFDTPIRAGETVAKPLEHAA